MGSKNISMINLEFSKINERHQTTEIRILENTKQNKHQSNKEINKQNLDAPSSNCLKSDEEKHL